MIKALAKGSGLFAIGSLPGGPRAYRYLTREVMGTQGSHILKLQRIWPEIASFYIELSGCGLEDKLFLIQECGWTPFHACLNFLTCGNGGILINTRVSGARLLERHATDAVNEALHSAQALSYVTPIPASRVRALEGLRWRKDIAELLQGTGTEYHRNTAPGSLPVASDAVDLIYSGGALEHYHPHEFRSWLGEAYRVLKPGGLLGFILDHRDHLHHFDGRLPFLYHYSVSATVYGLTRRNALLYHNRLLPREVMDMVSSAGMEKVRLMRRSVPVERWYVDGEEMEGDSGIERGKLRKEFQSLSDDDLRTAAAFYVYRKPL